MTTRQPRIVKDIRKVKKTNNMKNLCKKPVGINVLGSEQKGTRPVLIISSDSVNHNHNLSVLTVLPLSSIKKSDKV